jgi:hypothetical protein
VRLEDACFVLSVRAPGTCSPRSCFTTPSASSECSGEHVLLCSQIGRHSCVISVTCTGSPTRPCRSSTSSKRPVAYCSIPSSHSPLSTQFRPLLGLRRYPPSPTLPRPALTSRRAHTRPRAAEGSAPRLPAARARRSLLSGDATGLRAYDSSVSQFSLTATWNRLVPYRESRAAGALVTFRTRGGRTQAQRHPVRCNEEYADARVPSSPRRTWRSRNVHSFLVCRYFSYMRVSPNVEAAVSTVLMTVGTIFRGSLMLHVDEGA